MANYPEVMNPNYEATLPQSSSSRPSMYPSIDPVGPLFSPPVPVYVPSAPTESVDDSLLVIPGAILHLIDKDYSVELATGDLVLHRLRNGDNTIAVLASVSDDVQWPLTKDVATVKLDHSHYFFSFTAPPQLQSDENNNKKKTKTKKKKKNKKEKDMLSYGLTIASRGQESLVSQLDAVLESYSSFSVQKVEKKAEEAEVLGGAVAAARDLSPADLKSEAKKEVAEERCAAYWTTLAPNVEEYSGTAAKYIASGSGQLIKGILWCGDVTSDRLKWGNDVLRKRMAPGEKAEVSRETMKRIKRFLLLQMLITSLVV